jgi:hypothetical protein
MTDVPTPARLSRASLDGAMDTDLNRGDGKLAPVVREIP